MFSVQGEAGQHMWDVGTDNRSAALIIRGELFVKIHHTASGAISSHGEAANLWILIQHDKDSFIISRSKGHLPAEQSNNL